MVELMEPDYQTLLRFWFGDNSDEYQTYEERLPFWFRGPQSFDQEIQARFESWIPKAASGELSNWEQQPHGALALIILQDQFPRNIYRGTENAFAYDENALRIATKVVNSGMDRELKFLERIFAYLPFEHSEDIEIQQLSVRKFTELEELFGDGYFREATANSLEYAQMHYDIIEKFGRFPHRNDILGRKSTAKELEFMAAGAETFGQEKK